MEHGVNILRGGIMKFTNGYFMQDDKKRYIPLGLFAGYFDVELIDDEIGGICTHGDNVVPFYGLTKSLWRKFFSRLQGEGYTAIRLFPRGENFGTGGIGLDRGGSLNEVLFETFESFINTGGEYGIKTQLCLFSMPECSFFCNSLSRELGCSEHFRKESINTMPDFQQRFFRNKNDIVTYNDYFIDPDIRKCNKKFLDEIMPRIAVNDNIFSVELYNEMGWASPYSDVVNTFRWERAETFVEWAKDMVNHIKYINKDIPVCISNPGVGILGHDPYEWGVRIKPDFYSLHIYPDCCGWQHGFDFASMADMTYKYTSAAVPALYGEWQALGDHSFFKDNELRLLARDMVWMTMLSGASGCISWRGRGYGEYAKCTEVFSKLEGIDLTRKKPEVGIDISEFYKFAQELAQKGSPNCAFDKYTWCPDNSATDLQHRFCVKANDARYKILLEAEKYSLTHGVDYDLVQDNGEYRYKYFEKDAFAPISTSEGYQIKYLLNRDESVCVAYLRNFEYFPLIEERDDGMQYEKYAMRKQKPVSLNIRINLSGYKNEIYNLDTGEWIDLEDKKEIDLGINSHDYILLMKNTT